MCLIRTTEFLLVTYWCSGKRELDMIQTLNLNQCCLFNLTALRHYNTVHIELKKNCTMK